MKRSIFVVALVLAGSLAGAQTVTVSGTPAAAGPVDFEFLGQAIDSFAAGGANNGVVGANLINITAATVQLAAGSPGTYSIQDAVAIYEDVTIDGSTAPGGVATVLVGAEVGSTSDGFDITTDANLTFQNLNFIPQLTKTFTDDLITIDRQTVGGPSTITFTNCFFGANDGSNGVVDRTGQTQVVAAAGGNIPDDAITVFPDAGEDINFVLDQCVLQGSPVAGDGAVIAPNATAPNAGSLTLTDSVASFCGRLGIQQGGYADAEVVTVDGMIIYATGLGAPASFGNSWFTFNAGGGINRALTNSIFAVTHDRVLSLNGGVTSVGGSDFTNITGCILSDTAGGAGLNATLVVGQPGTDLITTNVSETTIHNTNGGTLVYLTDPANFDGCIFAGAGTAEVLFGNGYATGPVTVDDSAIVLAGPNAVNGGVAPGYDPLVYTTVVETNVINADPQFVQTTNPFAADYFQVTNPAYATAGIGGNPLAGGGSFVASVNEWSVLD